MTIKQILTAALLAASAPALAHAPKIGENGGQQTDAGTYHLEAVAKATTVDVYLRDHGNKAVETAGFKGTAILLINGKATRIPLAPAGGNRLTGTAPAPLGSAIKGAIQITTASGGTVQGKFN